MNNVFSGSEYFGAALTLVVYFAGVFLKKRFKWMNPLVFAVIVLIVILNVFQIDYEAYNLGAKHLSYLLTPVTVVLAIPLYRQIMVLKNHALEIIAGIVSGVITSLGSIFGLAVAFGLTHEEYATLLPKSITTAIGMGLSQEFGGFVTITIAVIMITGILGNVFGELILKLFRVREPIAKGVAMGTGAHAFGTMRALEIGEVEGAMSSLSVAVAGLITVVFASFFANLI